MLNDVRYALRAITKAPTFAAIVISTLALGIGANTAVFSVLNAVLLKPLPYADPQELVRLYLTYQGRDNFIPGPALADFRDRSRTVDIAGAYTYRAEGVDLTDGPQPERVGQLHVTADYFGVLRVQLLLGQPFDRSSERPEDRVAVVSARIWNDYLGHRADAIGRMLALDGAAYRVVGVMPEGFEDPLQPAIDIWTPLDMAGARADSWDNNYLTAIGRLRPGVSIEQAKAELASISDSQQSHYAARDARAARLARLQADIAGGSSQLLLILQGAAAMLLVIACVNVASLFLSRASAREAEVAVRAALGCSRARLVQQVLVESLVLAVAGGLAGLAVGLMVQRALVALAPFPFVNLPGLDARVFVANLVIACAAGLFFGVAPAVQSVRPDLEAVLREGGRGAAGSPRLTRTRNAFVVCQVALALVLLVGAGLLLRTFERLIHEQVGVRTDNVMTFEVNLPDARYSDPGVRARTHVELNRRLGSIPGVSAAGAVSRLPLTGAYHTWGTRRPDRTPEQKGVQPQQRVIEGHYLRALGIPIIQGRGFDDRDDERAPRRVLISRSLAAALFPGEDPIGHPLRVAGEPVDIIGVTGDAPIALRGVPPYTVYHSHRQFASNRNWPLVEVLALDRLSPTLLDEVRRQLAAIDPALVLYRPRLLSDVAAGGMIQERFALFLVGAFAGLAVVLAALGIYGVLSYAVAQRTREIGIRLALGAGEGSVRRLVVGQGARLIATGVIGGLAGAAWLTRALQSLLFKVSATDPLVFAAATMLIIGVALAAAWIPARVAARVNPLEAFRVS